MTLVVNNSRVPEDSPFRRIERIQEIKIQPPRNVVLVDYKDHAGNLLHTEFEISSTWEGGVPDFTFEF